MIPCYNRAITRKRVNLESGVDNMTVKELHDLCFHAKVKLKVDGTLYPLTANSPIYQTFSDYVVNALEIDNDTIIGRLKVIYVKEN